MTDYNDLAARLREVYASDGTNYVQEAARAIEVLLAMQKDLLADMALDLQRIEALLAERDRLHDFLLRNGFVPCDIPACNCGGWHGRYGLHARMDEIREMLAESGHPLSNENGNLTINALRELVAERDAMKLDAARYRRLRECHWHDSKIAVVCNPKVALKLGSYCPSHEQLDAAVDEMMKEGGDD